MDAINKYVSEVNHPCSFDVLADDVFLREELLQDELCVIVAIPKRRAAEFPATDAGYGACVMTRPDDLRQANLMLRDGKIPLPFHPRYARPHLDIGRLLLIYVFTDAIILETIPFTPDIYDDLCDCALSAQSRNHPTYAELMGQEPPGGEDGIVHVLDNRTSTRHKSED